MSLSFWEYLRRLLGRQARRPQRRGLSSRKRTAGFDFSDIRGLAVREFIDRGDDWEIILTGSRSIEGSGRVRIRRQNASKKDRDEYFAVLRFGASGSPGPATELLERLEALLELYAIPFLLTRSKDRRKALRYHSARAYLESHEDLFVESVGPGSWIASVLAKCKAGVKSLKLLAPLLTKKGLEHVERRVEATTRLSESAADRADFELLRDRLRAASDLMEALPEDCTERQLLRARLAKNIQMLLPDASSPDRLANYYADVIEAEFKDLGGPEHE